MSLGGVIAAELPQLRREAESRMDCVVQFFTTEDGTNPLPPYNAIQVEVPVQGPTIARLRSDDRAARDVQVAGQVPAFSTLVLSVPVGSVLVGADFFARVISSTSDDGLVGVVVKTKFEPVLGQVTAWRYPVEALPRGS